MKIYITRFTQTLPMKIEEHEHDKVSPPKLGFDNNPYSGDCFVSLTREEAKAYLVMRATANLIKQEKEYEHAKNLFQGAQEL